MKSAMNRIRMPLLDGTQWANVYDRLTGTLLVPVRPVPNVGHELRVDLSIGEGGPRVILRGHVVEAVDSGTCRIELAPTEGAKVTYIGAFVRGGLLNLRERRRLPLRLQVAFRAEGAVQHAVTRDINEEAAFVVTERPLHEDTTVSLEFEFPTYDKPIKLDGLIRHTVVVEDEDVPGMGITFRLDKTARAEFIERVNELERAFIAGQLPAELFD